MSEESKNRNFFIYIPKDNALIIWNWCESATIFRNCYSPHPCLVGSVSPLAIARTEVPKFDGFVSGARDDVITLRGKLNIGDIMIVAK